MKLDILEFAIFKALDGKTNLKYLLGVSGGMDSMALMHVFRQIALKYKITFSVCYVHHGSTNDEAQAKYRDSARELVVRTCQDYGINFLEKDVQMTPRSESEASMREFRLEVLRSKKFDAIVLAHHLDDLLETRLIRLIRGTGPQGLPAMQQWQGDLFRPFLNYPRSDLLKYAQKWDLKWLEDPSNQDVTKLRNWVRLEWLPPLEKMRPGSRVALARSLELLSQDSCKKPGQLAQSAVEEVLDRRLINTLAKTQQQRYIANFLKQHQVTNYSLNQINEVIKRLNTKRKCFEFKVAHLKWQVTDKSLRIAHE